MSIDTMTDSAGNWPHGCAQVAGLWLTRGGLRVRQRVTCACSGSLQPGLSGLSSDRQKKDDY